MKPSQNCIDLVKHFEGCQLKAYRCPADVLTIGYGHTSGVKEGDVCTQQQADEWLLEELTAAGAQIDILELSLNQNQFDCLCSFVYNLGVFNLQKSTLLRLIKSNPNDPHIPLELYRWVKAGGKTLQGLQFRRLSESHLYFTGELKFNWL